MGSKTVLGGGFQVEMTKSPILTSSDPCYAKGVLVFMTPHMIMFGLVSVWDVVHQCHRNGTLLLTHWDLKTPGQMCAGPLTMDPGLSFKKLTTINNESRTEPICPWYIFFPCFMLTNNWLFLNEPKFIGSEIFYLPLIWLAYRTWRDGRRGCLALDSKSESESQRRVAVPHTNDPKRHVQTTMLGKALMVVSGHRRVAFSAAWVFHPNLRCNLFR